MKSTGPEVVYIKDGWWEMPGEPVPSLGWPGTKNAQGHWVRRVVATPSFAQRVGESRQLHVVRYRLVAPRSRIRRIKAHLDKLTNQGLQLGVDRFAPACRVLTQVRNEPHRNGSSRATPVWWLRRITGRSCRSAIPVRRVVVYDRGRSSRPLL